MGLERFTPWLLLNLATFSVCASALVYLWWRRPPAPLWPSMPLSAVGMMLWAVGDAMAQLSTQPTFYEFSLFLYYTGSITAPAVAWRLALRFAEVQELPFRWSNGFWGWLPAVVAGLTWAGMATNPWTRAFVTPLVDELSPRNWLWWINAAATWATATGVVVLYGMLRLRHRSWVVRRKAAMMLGAYSAPLVLNLLYVTGLFYPPVDTTVAALTVSTVLVMAGVYRTGLFNPLPIAQTVLVENDPAGVVLLDPNGHALYANRMARALLPQLDWGPETTLLPRLAERLRRADGPQRLTPRSLREELENEGGDDGGRLYRLSGEPERHLRLELRPIRSARGEDVGRALRIQDVSDLVLAQRRAQESQARFRGLAEQSPDVIAEIGADGRFRWVSPSVARVLGLDPGTLAGRDPVDFMHPDEAKEALTHFEEVAEGTGQGGRELRFLRSDGSWCWLEVSGSPYHTLDGDEHFICIARDVTERRALLARLYEGQRFESLAALAGGVAHDFNKLLGTILGTAARMRDREVLEPGSIDAIERAAEQAAALTQALTAYAGRTPREEQRVCLADLVRGTGQLLSGSLPPGVGLGFDLNDPDACVEGDPGALQQVPMNLLRNAVEALGEGGGRIRLACGVARCGRTEVARARLGEREPDGIYVYLEVEDDGEGMSDAEQARIFDPFYSTRASGRGLGLAVVHGVVRGHRGVLWLTSAPGRGTRFRVAFPYAGSRLTSAQARP